MQPTTSPATGPAAVQDQTAAMTVMRRMFDEGFATGETAVVDELCAADISFTIEDSVERGDTIWVRVRAKGTATGPFFGPPSGRPIDITVVDIARIVNGRIVEHWGVPDRFALLAQTGVLSRLA
jgi:predicted ester cyclase